MEIFLSLVLPLARKEQAASQATLTWRWETTPLRLSVVTAIVTAVSDSRAAGEERTSGQGVRYEEVQTGEMLKHSSATGHWLCEWTPRGGPFPASMARWVYRMLLSSWAKKMKSCVRQLQMKGALALRVWSKEHSAAETRLWMTSQSGAAATRSKRTATHLLKSGKMRCQRWEKKELETS